MGFWQGIASADNTNYHTPYIVLVGIAMILMLLSIILIIYHCFYHGKGIDAETVKLILGLLGGGVLNAGASYFSKTTVSQITGQIAPGPSGGPKETKPE